MYQFLFQIFSVILWLSLLVLPTAPMLRFPKVALLIGLVSLVVYLKPKFHKTLIWYLIVVLLYACFNTFLGVLFNNPGALRVITVTIIWPILFFIISGYFKLEYISKIENVFKISTLVIIAICIFQLSEEFYQYKGISNYFFGEDSKSYINIEKSYASFSNPAMASLLFLGPFFLSRFIIEKRKSDLIYILLILIVSFIANRRGLLLAMGITIPVVLIFMFCSKIINLQNSIKIIFKSLVVIGVFVFILLYFYPELQYNFQNRFFDNKEASNIERTKQLPALLEGFFENVLFGKGAGASARVIRSYEQPWSYELFYISILFHQGIIGFLIYVASFGSVIFYTIKFAKQNVGFIGNHLIIIITASCVFLINSATNPYIGKLDYMWIIFYPIALINFLNRSYVKNNSLLKETI